MKSKYLYLALFFIFSCNPKQDQKEKKDINLYERTYHSQEPKYLSNRLDKTFLRSEPNISSKPITVIEAGTVVYFTGKISAQTFKAIIKGKEYDSPYMQVRLPNETYGWIFQPALITMEKISTNFTLSDNPNKSFETILKKKFKIIETKNPFTDIDCGNEKNHNFCYFQGKGIIYEFNNDLIYTNRPQYEGQSETLIAKNMNIKSFLEILRSSKSIFSEIDLPTNSSEIIFNINDGPDEGGFIELLKDNDSIKHISAYYWYSGYIYIETIAIEQNNIKYDYWNGP